MAFSKDRFLTVAARFSVAAVVYRIPMAPAANSILPPGNRRVNGAPEKRAFAIIRTKLSKIEQGAFFA
jgi:hypothetical protein